jgi:hypothetical protein
LPLHHRDRGGRYALFLSGFGVAGLSIAGTWSTRKKIRQALLAGSLIVMSCVFISCGRPITSQISQRGTPAGTFQITIHGNSGNQNVSIPVTLTIK